MDFIEGLPKSKGIDTILVVVDRLSKYAHFIGLKHPFSAATIASVFIKEIIRLHGVPSSIISDRDRIFLSLFWKELFKMQGTVLKHSTAFHPQTDGQSEIVNKALETYLRCFVGGQPRSWAEWLAWAEFWYNTSFHTSTNVTPFKVVYGRNPPPIIRLGLGQTTVNSVEELLQARDAILDDLRIQLHRAQQQMKQAADTHRHDVEFEIGDKVFLKLQPYKQKSLASRPFQKLAARFFGPFEILQRIGKVAYRLALPHSCQIHPVFHVSQLKKAIGTQTAQPTIPPQLSADLELLVEPLELLAVRPFPLTDINTCEVLIRWKDMPMEDATWEDYQTMLLRFPTFHLEDKVKVWGGGNVMTGPGPPVQFVYSRRKRKLNE